MLPDLESCHDTVALTLAGHAGGPPVPGRIDGETIADAVERTMDDVGWPTAHLLGNSLGGYVALQLAARGRAASVVALAPAGGWHRDDDSFKELLAFQRMLREQARAAAPHLDAMLASPEGRRRATGLVTVNFEHIPSELIARQILASARCPAAEALIETGLREAWELDAAAIACPVRIVWGTGDRLLPWPQAASRYRDEWLPHADWVLLDDVGHCPQLDVPLETSQLVLGFTAP